MWNTTLKGLLFFVGLFFIITLFSTVSPAQEGVCEKSPSVVEFILKEPTHTKGVFAQVTDPEEVLAIKNRLVEVGNLVNVEAATWHSIDVFVPKQGEREGMLFVVLYDENECAIRGFWDYEDTVIDFLEAALGRRM